MAAQVGGAIPGREQEIDDGLGQRTAPGTLRKVVPRTGNTVQRGAGRQAAGMAGAMQRLHPAPGPLQPRAALQVVEFG